MVGPHREEATEDTVIRHWSTRQTERVHQKPDSIFILDFWPPKLWENVYLLFKPPRVWYFVKAALQELPYNLCTKIYAQGGEDILFVVDLNPNEIMLSSHDAETNYSH